jgi:hypothetical protein
MSRQKTLDLLATGKTLWKRTRHLLISGRSAAQILSMLATLGGNEKDSERGHTSTACQPAGVVQQ